VSPPGYTRVVPRLIVLATSGQIDKTYRDFLASLSPP
jgi:hypothetical protein